MVGTMWRQSILGAFWTTGSQVCLKILQLVIFVCLARLIAPYTFGVIAFANLFFFLLQSLLNGGLTLVIVRAPALDHSRIESIFWMQILIGGTLTACIALTAEAGMLLFGSTDILRAFLALSPLGLLYALGGVPYALLLRKMRFKHIAFASLLALTAGGCVAIPLAWAGWSLTSLITQYLVYALVALVAYASFEPWRPRGRFSLTGIRQDLSFACGSWADIFVRYWSTSIDRLLVATLFGPVALGFYDLAQRICINTFTVFCSTISSVALPVFAQLQSDLSRTRSAIMTATPLAYFVAMPISILLMLLAPELIALFFGAQWMPSVPLVRVLALLGFVYPATYFLSPLILAFGKPSWNLFLSLFVLIAMITGMLLTARWSVVAVAWVMVIVNVCAAVPAFLLARRFTALSVLPYLRSLLPMGTAGAAMTVALLLTRPTPDPTHALSLPLVLSVVTGCAVYLIVALILSRKMFKSIRALFV